MAQRTSLLFDVYVLQRAVGILLGEALAGDGLRPDEYAVYSYLLETPDASPTTMARALNMAPQTVSDWLQHLQRRGHIVKAPRPSDRRSYVVGLSDEGRRAHAAARHGFDRANRHFLEALTRSESDLRGCLAEVIHAAEQATLRLRAGLTARAG